MPSLVTNAVNVNDPKVVRELVAGLKEFIHDGNHYHRLTVKGGAHFSTLPETLPNEAGWYVILAGKHPLYVGEAENLDVRLNSDNGSRDNFLNPKRTSDAERNFIKKFADLELLPDLRVWFVTERDLSSKVEIKIPLSGLDRCNIEKILNVCRGELQECMMSPGAS